MWIPILLVCSLHVSGAVWAKKNVRGVVGRPINVECHYAAEYRSRTKYWCHGWSRQCTVLVKTNGQHGRRGRVSITDNTTLGIFTVTMENLHSGDTGWYSCGIATSGLDPMFGVHLQVSDEPVSVPVLGFLSPANVSCVGGSVTVSCRSERGSLPISYSWSEKTSSVASTISNNNTLDLHCQSFKHHLHQYYCRASNIRGTKDSEMVNVEVSNITEKCSYVMKLGENAPGYSCETSRTETVTSASSAISNIRTSHSDGKTSRSDSSSKSTYIIVLSVTGVLLVVIFACLLLYVRNRHRESKSNTHRRGKANGTQEIPPLEKNAVYANLQYSRDDEAAAQLADNDGGIMYAAVKFQRRSRMEQSGTNKDNVISQGKHSVTSEDNVTNANVKFPRSPANLQDSAQTIYASVAS